MAEKIYELRRSVEAFILWEGRKPANSVDIHKRAQAKRFLELLGKQPFKDCYTIEDLKKQLKNVIRLEKKSLDRFSDGDYEETQLSFFPTAATNESVARQKEKLKKTVEWYETALDICDYKTCVAARFKIESDGEVAYVYDSLAFEKTPHRPYLIKRDRTQCGNPYELAKEYMDKWYRGWTQPQNCFDEI